MKIEILKRTTINGEPVTAGQVADVDDRDARYLIGAGKAQEVAGLMPVAVTSPDVENRPRRTRKPIAA